MAKKHLIMALGEHKAEVKNPSSFTTESRENDPMKKIPEGIMLTIYSEDGTSWSMNCYLPTTMGYANKIKMEKDMARLLESGGLTQVNPVKEEGN